MEDARQLPIAVIGVSALMPGSVDVQGFWRDILMARDLITDVPATHWLVDDYYDPDPAAQGKTYAHRGAFLPDLKFDPAAFGLPPSALPATDTSQLLALIAADRLLSDIEAAGASVARDRVGVILGSSALPLLGEMSMASGRPHWLKGLRESGIAEPEAQQICDRIAANYVSWQENTFPGLLSNVVAGRVANRFDLGGTNCTVDAACASALAALSVAVGELTLGSADMMITGAVDTLNDHTTYQCFSKTHALSPTGDCRPFSDAADGTMLGEGVALFALKRLTDAERDDNPIYAVIRGVGSSSDGRGTAIYAPLPAGQAVALRRAYRAAGYSPNTVGLVEAHGTGTAAGDLAEVTALREVFGDDGAARQRCALGSVKSQIGHTKACAGGAGLLKAVLALHHKVLPPTIKVNRPNPALELETSPFYLNTSVRPWIHGATHPRRASVSSFGFGGTNFHVTLEEYAPAAHPAYETPHRLRCLPAELVLLSAESPAALQAKMSDLDLALPISEIGHRSRQDFDADDGARLALVAADASELAEKLTVARKLMAEPSQPVPIPASGVYYGRRTADPGAVAFLFPGQGAQYVGMGGDLAVHFPAAQKTWENAGVWEPVGFSAAEIVFPRPASSDAEREEQTARLTATEWAQPALAIHSLALLELLQGVQVRPDAVAGHSAGELTALHVGGAFDAHALVMLARRRGELMRDVTAESPGAMLAVSASAVTVAEVVDPITNVWLVNYNAPQQVVLSGSAEAISEAECALTASGTPTRRLRTGTAFHSPMVAAATGPLREFLNGLDIQGPHIPVYGNADAAPYPSGHDDVRDRIATQLGSPVRFADQIEQMYRAGVRTFIEVGAGATLTTLVGQILGDRDHLAVSTDRHGRNGVRSFFEALGALAVGGVRFDPAPLWAHYAPLQSSDTAPGSTAQGKMQVTINGSNYGRPYPPPGGATELPPPNPAVSNSTSVTPTDSARDRSVPVHWPQLFTELHRHTAEAQAVYQRTTAEAHTAYLRAAEASVTAMAQLLGADTPGCTVPGLPDQAAPAHPGAGSEFTDDVARARPPALDTMPGAIPSHQHEVQTASPGTADPGPAADLAAVLLSVVADKTGYPVEVLEPSMDMEADLGIDSIKRVEIVSAMREHVPALQQSASSDLSRLGSLRTLEDVVGQLRELETPAQAPMAPTKSGHQTTGDTLSRFTVRAVEAPATGYAMRGLGDGPIAITDDGMGVAPRLVRALADRGVAATAVTSGVPADHDGVVFLGGLRAPGSVREALDVQREAFRISKAMAPRFASRPGVFVTVQRTGGDFGLAGTDPTKAWLAGLAGLSRTLQHEWSQVSVKAIDCGFDGADAVAMAIADELTHGGPELDVGLCTGRRITLHTAPMELTSSPHDWLNTDPVIVASGGARGITAAALCALAEKYRCRLLLFGRTPLTGIATDDRADAEIHATINRLQRRGADVRYRAVDIRDAAAVADAVAQARRDWGPITGLVHGAGVLADKLVADKTTQQFDEVFSTKVDGLRALLNATTADPLQLICLFSSVVGHHGNRGQCDYAMANATLTSVAAAEAANRPDCLVRSLGWGPWAGGMVSAPVAELLQARGIPLIAPEAGSQAFVAELEGPRDQVEVMLTATDSAGRVPFLMADQHREAVST